MGATRTWTGSAASRVWPPAHPDGTTIHHVSDTHAGFRPWASAVLDGIRRDVAEGLIPAPDAVVNTGDLTDHSEPAEDAYMLDWLPGVARGVPDLWVPGNHDLYSTRTTAAQWSTIYGRPANSVLDVGPYRLLGFAPSSWAEHTPWTIAEPTWSWLDAQIAAAPGPVVLVCHYPPWELGAGVTDDTAVQPRARLAELVSAHPAVEGFLAGHMHWRATDPAAAQMVTLGGRRLPVLMGASPVLAPDLTRDQAARLEPVSTYVTMTPGERWTVRYRRHGPHAWGRPGGVRATTLCLSTGSLERV